MPKRGKQQINIFKMHYWNDATLVGKYRLPQLEPTQFIPHEVVGFNERSSVRNPKAHWIDFFIDDIHFECIWNRADFYLEKLAKFDGVITPDFSMLPEMVPGQIIWNNTRNRVLAYYMQKHNINIIPTASWCYRSDFDWCFDGLPEDSSIAVSTNGCKSSPYGLNTFMRGVEELYRQKNPSHLIVCGRKIEELSNYDNIIYYPCFSQRLQERLKYGK